MATPKDMRYATISRIPVAPIVFILSEDRHVNQSSEQGGNSSPSLFPSDYLNYFLFLGADVIFSQHVIDLEVQTMYAVLRELLEEEFATLIVNTVKIQITMDSKVLIHMPLSHQIVHLVEEFFLLLFG